MLQGAKTHLNKYLIKQLPKATAFINNKLVVVHISNMWLNDFDLTNDMVIGKSVYELFGHKNKGWSTLIKNCIEGKSSNTNIQSYINYEGNEKLYEWTSTPWYDEHENTIGIIINVDNVTLKIENELKLEKLQILSNEMADFAKIGVWEYNMIEDNMYWSNMTKMIHEVTLDYEPNLESATNFYKIGYNRNTISMIVENAIENNSSWNEKFQLITAKGKEIWVITSGKPLYKNNKFIGLVGTIQDITELTRTETKTQENEYLLRTLIDNLPLNIFIKDLESKKILVNKSEMDFCGVTDENEILGKDNFAIYDKETAIKTREDDLTVIQSRKALLNREMPLIKQDGTIATFLTSKVPLINPSGEVYGLVGISMDISDIKKQEQELRGLINVTSQQNKKLLDFTHIVSHNLRSHTANFSMLLKFLITEKNEDEKEKLIQMMVGASDNLLETLSHLNEVLAISTNINLEKECIPLNKKITQIEQNLEACITNNNVKIINTIANDVCVRAIPAYLDNILMNFITNAIKFRQPDEDPIIKLNARSEKEYTILSITDNGLGIDLKKYGQKLFGMYKTFHYKKGAKGIGLFIAKKQIEAMNGKITVTSKVGSGTTFNIFFDEKN